LRSKTTAVNGKMGGFACLGTKQAGADQSDSMNLQGKVQVESREGKDEL
jgi:hypothetical protein